MKNFLEKDPVLCPHCGAEQLDDDDLCRFCGKAMVPAKSAQSTSEMVSSGLRSLKEKVRPMTAEELDETLISADFSNPANPIWDD
jgi:predicted amidophosphoribosyltransferase